MSCVISDTLPVFECQHDIALYDRESVCIVNEHADITHINEVSPAPFTLSCALRPNVPTYTTPLKYVLFW